MRTELVYIVVDSSYVFWLFNSQKKMSRPTNFKNPFAGVKYEHLVAGVSGGVASTLILHPLDLLKIRFAGKFFFQVCLSILFIAFFFFTLPHF